MKTSNLVATLGIPRRAMHLAALALLFGAGCPKQAPTAAVDLTWPAPPDPAVIRFVGEIRDSSWAKPTSARTRAFRSLIGSPTVDVGFIKPWGVAVDSRGRVFVTDQGHHKVAVFDRAGKAFDWLGNTGNGTLTIPTAITTDGRDHIFVSDSGAHRVVEYDPDFNYVMSYGGTEGPGAIGVPGGMRVSDDRHELWVADTEASVLKVYTVGGEFLRQVGSQGSGDGQFYKPVGIALTKDYVYVADMLNFRVEVIDYDGNHVRQWGGNCNAPGCFQRIKGIDVDSLGDVYVSDAAFSNVQMFDPAGQLLMFFGTGGERPGDLYLPAGLDVDAHDHIWVVSQYSWRVSEFEFLGAPKVPSTSDTPLPITPVEEPPSGMRVPEGPSDGSFPTDQPPDASAAG